MLWKGVLYFGLKRNCCILLSTILSAFKVPLIFFPIVIELFFSICVGSTSRSRKSAIGLYKSRKLTSSKALHTWQRNFGHWNNSEILGFSLFCLNLLLFSAARSSKSRTGGQYRVVGSWRTESGLTKVGRSRGFYCFKLALELHLQFNLSPGRKKRWRLKRKVKQMPGSWARLHPKSSADTTTTLSPHPHRFYLRFFWPLRQRVFTFTQHLPAEIKIVLNR